MTRHVLIEYLILIGLCAGLTVWAAVAGYAVTAGICGGLTVLTLCLQWVYGGRDTAR